MKYRIKATKEIVELRTWKRDDGAIKLVDKYGKMGFWPDEVEPAEQLGWHPASELPPVDEIGESEYLIAYDLDGYAFSAFYSRKKGWCDDDGRDNLEIEWWCYPPINS